MADVGPLARFYGRPAPADCKPWRLALGAAVVSVLVVTLGTVGYAVQFIAKIA